MQLFPTITIHVYNFLFFFYSRQGRSRKNLEPATGDEAQKKFANAKAISSDQFFGNKDTDVS